MGTPERPDRRPIVFVPDTSNEERNLRRLLPAGRRLRVYDDSTRIGNSVRTMDAARDALKRLDKKGVSFDKGLFLYALLCVSWAKDSDVDPEKFNIRRKAGFSARRLHSVGCRVYMTNEQIGSEYGCTREHVNRNIRVWKEHGLVIRRGRGWFEFDPRLVWRGSLELQSAYIEYVMDEQRAADPEHPANIVDHFDKSLDEGDG